MRIEQLIYLVAIVETGSLTKAANKLYVSQPALTVAINEMETEIGTPLFSRTNHGTYPTEIGLIIYNDCKEILSLWDQKLDKWKDIHLTMDEVNVIKDDINNV